MATFDSADYVRFGYFDYSPLPPPRRATITRFLRKDARRLRKMRSAKMRVMQRGAALGFLTQQCVKCSALRYAEDAPQRLRNIPRHEDDRHIEAIFAIAAPAAPPGTSGRTPARPALSSFIHVCPLILPPYPAFGFRLSIRHYKR